MDKIKTILKKNGVLRRIGKRINNINIFKYDEKSFSQCFMDSALREERYDYSIMMLVHSLEKGMCMKDVRPFGFEKVMQLKKHLEDTRNKESFEYKLGVSALFSWKTLFDEMKWEKNKEYSEIELFLKEKKCELETGKKKYIPTNINTIDMYKDIISSRHSVRDFANKKIDINDLEKAIKCFIETPTACNRQMCKLLFIEDLEIKELFDKNILGIHGVNKNTVHYFVVTYDLASLAYSGERQQGMFNAGLCTTNFINALHASGIGSCCLQWSNKRKEDVIVRNKLGLNKSERIAIVIGAGYYKDLNYIPCSTRKEISNIFRII